MDTTEQKNFHHLVMNTFWFGMAYPAISRFLSVYAIHVGASAVQLGLIVSLPGIASVFAASLSQRWMRRYTTSRDAVAIPAFFLRLNWLLLVFTPFFPPQWQPVWIILAMAIPALAEGVSTVAFMVMMREAVNPVRITALISRRQVAMNMALGIATLGFGFWLENVSFPFNYQFMFAISFFCALGGLWHSLRVKVQPMPRPHDSELAKAHPISLIWRTPGFLSVVAITVTTHIAFFSIAPIIPLRLVNEMGAGEQFMAIFGLAELGAAFAMASATGRIVARIGSRALITYSMLGTALAAVILALAPNLGLTLLAAALSGASWTAAGVAMFSYFAEKTPLQDAPRYTMIYMQIIYLGMFIGPLIGSSLASSGVKLVMVLLCGASLRLIVGIATQYSPPQIGRWPFRRAVSPVVK